MPVSRPPGPGARRAVRTFRGGLERLEPRQLMSLAALTQPTADEQYMLELINRARANPQAEAQRLAQLSQSDPTLHAAVGNWNINTFVQVLSGMPPEPPLAFNTRLIAAARARDREMLAANSQTHMPSGYLTNPAVASVPDGQPYYPVSSSAGWATGENVFAFSRNVPVGSSVQQYLDYLYEGLMIDWNNPDFGHLKNIMNYGPSQGLARGALPYSEIGIGVLENANPSVPPTSNPVIAFNRGLSVGPVIVAQEFGWRSGIAFLTGTFYQDRNGDNFYTPGEGLGGVTISASGVSGQGTFTTQTWGSGGYSLQLPPGTYVVTATGNLPAPQSKTVTIGQDNVGWSVQVPGPLPADVPVPGDYDGDGKTDVAIYRPDTAAWYISLSSTGQTVVRPWGWPMHDVPVPGDYDGDGKTDIAVYRPETATWYISLSPGGTIIRPYGQAGNDVPVPADYDGDGKTNIAVYRPNTATWYILGPSGSQTVRAWGWVGHDVPVPGDYDGDGKADIAVYRPETATWYVLGSAGGTITRPWGWPMHDVPVPADYDGDGKTDIAVYRPETGEWFELDSRIGSQHSTFGGNGPSNLPEVGDYDGDGKADPSVVRSSDMTWFQLRSRSGQAAFRFGRSGPGQPVSTRLLPTLANTSVLTSGTAAAIPAEGPAASKSTRSAHPVPPRAGLVLARRLEARRLALQHWNAHRRLRHL